jgi:hypothetical protein
MQYSTIQCNFFCLFPSEVMNHGSDDAYLHILIPGSLFDGFIHNTATTHRTAFYEQTNE